MILPFLPSPRPLQPAANPATVLAVFLAEGFLHRLLLSWHVTNRYQDNEGRDYRPRGEAAQKHGQTDQRNTHAQVHGMARDPVRSADDETGGLVVWFHGSARPLEDLVRPDVQHESSQDRQSPSVLVGRWNQLVHWYQEVQQEHGYGCHEEPGWREDEFQLHSERSSLPTVAIQLAQFTGSGSECKPNAPACNRLAALGRSLHSCNAEKANRGERAPVPFETGVEEASK